MTTKNKYYVVLQDTSYPEIKEIVIRFDAIEVSIVLASILSFIIFWKKIINKKTLNFLRETILQFQRLMPQTANNTDIDDLLLKIIDIGLHKIPEIPEDRIELVLEVLKKESVAEKEKLLQNLISTNPSKIVENLKSLL
ncbi:MAG: hypothetical protein CV045_02940 [Cyanobacteria bacterium M5B4]|nr:MAG: hypothetical protein CV045_02940 [Cyanobacteria bacterium M5B4]